MSRFIVLSILALVASMGLLAYALAADLTVTFNDQQQQIVLQALDAYVKNGGINVAGNALAVLQAMQEAAKTQKPSQPQAKP